MPDKRKHRGPRPQDAELFAASALPALRTALAEYSWLLTRGYAVNSALKLVGDRHGLTARQRLAVMRSSCSDQSLRRRLANCVPTSELRGRPLAIDGYNLLITVESALARGIVLIGRDGAYRDLAGIHGTYRKVEETIPALQLVFRAVTDLAPARVAWYLDRPVSNSGRLKKLMEELLETATDHCLWTVELVASPDKALAVYSGIVASSDSAVLEQVGEWFGLARHVVSQLAPSAWLIDLRDSTA